ncbi:MAG: PepSY domain-containing protein [Gammaproteobacteria bacterium]|jgi:uncharacterized membrane protein YkoI|nr:PepSY domain-containing protein [Gammaproteobacteria bacterium]
MKATGSILLAVALLGASALAQADRRTSLDDAVSEARDRYPGRVLSAETDRRGGRESYKIRILTRDGRVKRLRVDPESGRVQRGRHR